MTVTDDPRIFAEVKRFRERWIADDRFRSQVASSPRAAAAAAGLGIDAERLSSIWQPGVPADETTPEGAALRLIEDRSQAYHDFCADDGGAGDVYRNWRKRQQARSAFAQGAVVGPMALHLPFTVELTRGCSLGCWFCGISAVPLEAVLPTDAVGWEKMLTALRGIFGASAVRGFLYWATDPLDHPDYETYGEVFRTVLGRFPATTTAAPLADPARTRRLIEISRAGASPSLRFSIVSLRQLNDVHAAFSAEEIADVDLVPVNRESILALAEAGRARKKAGNRPDRAALERRKLSMRDDDEMMTHRTIACVSGFLIEPVIGRIRLISPEPCSDRWPDGYVVFDEARFRDAAEFESALERLVADNMKPDARPDSVALQRGVTVTARSALTVEANGRGWRATFFSQRRPLHHMPALARAFRGGAAVEPTVERIAREFEIAPATVRKDTVNLWRQGVLIEPIFAFADIDEAPDAAAADMPPPRPRRMTA